MGLATVTSLLVQLGPRLEALQQLQFQQPDTRKFAGLRGRAEPIPHAGAARNVAGILGNLAGGWECEQD